MIFKEVRGDLFSDENTGAMLHCISRDCEMGKGIAVEFRKRYPKMQKHVLKELEGIEEKYTAVYYEEVDKPPVINLITKKRYFNKPTYASLEMALIVARGIIIKNGIRKITMPRIASGLDRLMWEVVQRKIQLVFRDIDIEIIVYSKER